MNYRKALVIGAALVVVLVAALPAGPGAEVVASRDYEPLDDRLEPFLSDFNEASSHVRAVLLVGPT